MKYLMMMLIFATIAFIETILLKILTQANLVPWTQCLLKTLKTNKVTKYFIFSPFDEIVDALVELEAIEVEVEVEQVKVELISDWTVLCRFIDRTFFIVFATAFVFYNGK